MATPDEVVAEVAHHVEILMAHDPGDREFASIARRFARLHHVLVPERDEAASVQGEIIRSVDRLASEERRNGCINWDDHYENMVRFLRAQLVDTRGFAEPRRARIAEDLDVVMRNGRGERGGDRSRVDIAFGRLIMDAVAFASAKPDLIPLGGAASPADA